MLGTVVNTGAIILGSLVGILIKGGISEKISNTIMKALALAVLYIGISGTFKSDNMIIIILSLAIGAFVGELIDIDRKLSDLGVFIENKVNSKSKGNDVDKNNSTKISIAQGFVYASLIFCVGAMSIVGSLESGLQGNHSTLFAKSILDGISSIIFTASLGIGTIFSALSVFIYQGVITISASMLATILSSTVIDVMTAVGSLLIIGLALNILLETKIKVANMLPAVFIPIIFNFLGFL